MIRTSQRKAEPETSAEQVISISSKVSLPNISICYLASRMTDVLLISRGCAQAD